IQEFTTQAYYNDNDYQKIVFLLEQQDEDGIKNGEKVSSNYNADDPNTWGNCFTWDEIDGEYRIIEIDISRQDLYGNLDLSGCTELEVLDTYMNAISNINITDTKLGRNEIKSEGLGYVSYANGVTMALIDPDDNFIIYDNCEFLYAEPKEHEEFLGWYDENGELISTESELYISDEPGTVFTAVFTGEHEPKDEEPPSGDIDGDGVLSFGDVTLLYYYLLNNDMAGFNPENLQNADMNHDGVLSVLDITLMFNILLDGV
ncbi:MAG: dockerin type I repeat-containing protein, partial [Clostridia bacterium]|nr:dockerin type I repeat-containing protein [Clostridia bacterium]